MPENSRRDQDAQAASGSRAIPVRESSARETLALENSVRENAIKESSMRSAHRETLDILFEISELLVL
jgi:hypothetical protein